jgi:glycolate oxidase FAD binding subunit
MKNVAGYDVSRLMPGSLGTLALLLDVSIKVLPKAVATATLQLEIEQEKAIHMMNLLASQPWPINASCWQGEQNGILHIRLSGAKAAVESATSSFKKNLGMQLLDPEEAKIFWASLREQQSDWFQSANTNASPLWRFAVAPTSKPLNLAGSTLIEWHGGQRWWQGKLDATTAKAIAAEADGHASIFRSSLKDISMLSSLNDNPLTKALVPVQDRLQKAFDPHGIFATGRLA